MLATRGQGSHLSKCWLVYTFVNMQPRESGTIPGKVSCLAVVRTHRGARRVYASGFCNPTSKDSMGQAEERGSRAEQHSWFGQEL